MNGQLKFSRFLIANAISLALVHSMFLILDLMSKKFIGISFLNTGVILYTIFSIILVIVFLTLCTFISIKAWNKDG